MNPGFWAGKRVLLTGHTGFKGTWLALWLSRLGARVTGYALAPQTEPSLWHLAGPAPEISSVLGDVNDESALARTFELARPEVVFHLAAQSLVRRSYDDPAGTYATNVIGTVNVLEAVRRSVTTKVLVNVTSDKCYENRETGQEYRETDALGGFDPYSSSKACAELVTAAYRKSFFSNGEAGIATGRAGNVIGGGDWAADRLIPDLVRGALLGAPTLIRNPQAVRPWQHVLEPLAGYVLLAERLWGARAQFAGGWNFGPPPASCIAVANVADFVVKHLGPTARWTNDASDHPHEAKLLALDSSKAQTELGWQTRLTLQQALMWTVDWYKTVSSGKPARTACLEQIEQYMSYA